MVKKGRLHSACFNMNQFKDAILPMSFWTPFYSVEVASGRWP
jgi:hypothetical protein